jgi:membrane protease YdiL (CAAX protease family)
MAIPAPKLKTLPPPDSTSDDRLAARLRGFGPFGIIAILAILAGNLLFVPLSGVLVLVWVVASRTQWRDVGLVRPKSWASAAVLGVMGGVALKLVLKALILPLLGAPAVNPAYHYLAANRAAIPATLWALVAGAGFGEEIVFRGYLFERFGKLFGPSSGAKVATVLITSLWFGGAHWSTQGLAGTEQAVITGLVFGTTFAITRRLPGVMIAHASFDLAAYALIYWAMEERVARLVFR